MPDRERAIQGQIIFGSDQGRVEDPKCTGEEGEVRYAPNKAALEPIIDTHEVFLKTENRQHRIELFKRLSIWISQNSHSAENLGRMTA